MVLILIGISLILFAMAIGYIGVHTKGDSDIFFRTMCWSAFIGNIISIIGVVMLICRM